MKKVVLAYSGGLDTTYCLLYLHKIKNMQVHAVMVDTYGMSDIEINNCKNMVLNLGPYNFEYINAVIKYYENFVKYLIYGNILKNNIYPLSVSAERAIQAILIAKYAKSINAEYIAHGSTGAGNDQIRFDMIFNILIPNIKIITPIRDNQLSRQEEINFLKSQNVKIDFKKSIYSINKGLWGTSIGGKETLTSDKYLPEEAFNIQSKINLNNCKKISLSFDKGELCGINDIVTDPIKIIKTIENLGNEFRIGYDMHVGDTIIGIKGRVGIKIAAPLIIIKAHHLLEKHTLSKSQLYWKDIISMWYGNYLHEGHILDPVMTNIECFLKDTQKTVSGKVYITLYPYRFILTGIESNYDLMQSKENYYGEINTTWTSNHVKGFTKIFGNSNAIFYQKNKLYNNFLKKIKFFDEKN